MDVGWWISRGGLAVADCESFGDSGGRMGGRARSECALPLARSVDDAMTRDGAPSIRDARPGALAVASARCLVTGAVVGVVVRRGWLVA